MPTSRSDRILLEFGKRLKKARKRKFPSAAQFAYHLGMEPPAYRKYERGGASPNLETLTRIYEHLGVTPNDLLPEAAQPRPEKRAGTAA